MIWDVHTGSRIWSRIFFHSDQGSKKAPDPGAQLARNAQNFEKRVLKRFLRITFYTYIPVIPCHFLKKHHYRCALLYRLTKTAAGRRGSVTSPPSSSPSSPSWSGTSRRRYLASQRSRASYTSSSSTRTRQGPTYFLQCCGFGIRDPVPF